MSSRSIISSTLGCKYSFDHSLHFVSIYQSQGSVNPKQQHSNSKETWAPRALTASWRGGVGFCLFSKLFTSKNFPTAAGLSSERQRKPFLSHDRHSKSESQSPRLLLLAHRCCGGSETGTGEGGIPLRAKPLLCRSMCKAAGADPQRAEVIRAERPRSWSAPEQGSHGFGLLASTSAADTALRTKQKRLFSLRAQEANRGLDSNRSPQRWQAQIL